MSVQVLVENLTTLLEAIRHSGWYHPKMQEELPSLRIFRGSCGFSGCRTRARKAAEYLPKCLVSHTKW